jgi:hypothetical protein
MATPRTVRYTRVGLQVAKPAEYLEFQGPELHLKVNRIPGIRKPVSYHREAAFEVDDAQKIRKNAFPNSMRILTAAGDPDQPAGTDIAGTAAAVVASGMEGTDDPRALSQEPAYIRANAAEIIDRVQVLDGAKSELRKEELDRLKGDRLLRKERTKFERERATAIAAGRDPPVPRSAMITEDIERLRRIREGSAAETSDRRVGLEVGQRGGSSAISASDAGPSAPPSAVDRVEEPGDFGGDMEEGSGVSAELLIVEKEFEDGFRNLTGMEYSVANPRDRNSELFNLRERYIDNLRFIKGARERLDSGRGNPIDEQVIIDKSTRNIENIEAAIVKELREIPSGSELPTEVSGSADPMVVESELPTEVFAPVTAYERVKNDISRFHLMDDVAPKDVDLGIVKVGDVVKAQGGWYVHSRRGKDIGLHELTAVGKTGFERMKRLNSIEEQLRQKK